VPARRGARRGSEPGSASGGDRAETGARGTEQDQLRLSKAEYAKPSAPGARAAREDDWRPGACIAQAQSRVTDLEKNVADLQKLLE